MKKIEQLISKFQEFKEELNKDINSSYGSSPNSGSSSFGNTATAGGTATINSQIGNPFGKEEGDKPNMGHSSFTMDHVNAVVKMPHHEAKAYAHNIVDTSTANPMNKAKMKMMIDKSRSSGHLAQGMSNHILAHPSEGYAVKSEHMSVCKNGQWNISSGDLPKEGAKPDSQEVANINKPHPISGQRHILPIPSQGAPDKDTSVGTKTMKMDKVDPEETVNIEHPKTKAKIMPMAHKPNKNK